ncbi:MAG: hypothetical protein NC913_08405 [Candidatus Omnitrophica bacterium]|nr:hypothetical protein [Candidatus Omnitrophota bacterium]
MEQKILLKNRIHRKLKNKPITYGICWPEGSVVDEQKIALFDENGNQIVAGISVLNRWPDGSIQWALVDFNIDLEESSNRLITAKIVEHAELKTPENPVKVETKEKDVIISNGVVKLVLSCEKGKIIKNWSSDEKNLIESFDITFKDEKKNKFSANKGSRTITIEHYNPIRCVVRIDGKHGCGKKEMLDYFLRFEIFAGKEDVKITYCFRNRELPTPGIKISSLYLVCKLTEDGKKCFAAKNLTRYYKPGFLRVNEDICFVASDTPEIENYEKSHQKDGRGLVFVKDEKVLCDPVEEKPWFMRNVKYRMSVGNRLVFPYIALIGKNTGVIAHISQMSCLYPKEIKTKKNTFYFGIWPDWAKQLSITQGAGRSHTIILTPIKPDASDMEIQDNYLLWEVPMHAGWPAQSPVEIICDIEHNRKCKVFGIEMLPEYDMENRPLFEKKILYSWIHLAYGSLGWTEEVVPMPPIGFWDYGDNGANNEEMFGHVYFQNYFRSGNWTCAENGIAIARHILEVDFVDFSIDKLQNGGMVAHCLNHNDGAVYPSHMWFTELLFAYVLTGDMEFKRAALKICENLLMWVNDYFWIVSADHRESGQPIINLTWCYHFNRDERYLKACEKIIKENLMQQVKKYGKMFVPKPSSMPIKLVRYGDYASWEGMFWYWKITGDEEVKRFMLSQLEWRLSTQFMTPFAYHRVSDINPAAYAYYMTGDRSWLDRIAKFIKAAFRCAQWPIGWIHSMYALKIAFDLGIISDDDITPQ